jgi:hypothetical protein
LQIRLVRFDSGPRLQEFNAGVAQLVERDLAKVEVTSSSLVTRSRKPVRTGFGHQAGQNAANEMRV